MELVANYCHLNFISVYFLFVDEVTSTTWNSCNYKVSCSHSCEDIQPNSIDIASWDIRLKDTYFISKWSALKIF